MADSIPSRSLVAAGWASLAVAMSACGKHTTVPLDPPAPSASLSNAYIVTPPVVASSTTASTKSGADDDLPEPLTPSPLATTCQGVSLVLVTVRVTANPTYLEPVLELRNASSEHVPLMLPGDGSTSKGRNPTLTYELTPNNVTTLGGCGNTNGLSPSNFTFLAPGERKTLEWVSPGELPAKRGQYTFRATYKNDPTSTQLGDNMPSPRTDRLTARARKTVSCTLVSNAVSFTWPG